MRRISLALLLPLSLCAQPKTQTNSVGMEFVLAPAGSFTMGRFAPACSKPGPSVTEPAYQECMKLAREAAKPGFKAEIPKAFYIGKFEVTQDQYTKVMGKNPSFHTQAKVNAPTGNYPVDSISWQDAQAFVKKLNSMEKTNAYRLPTEAEWEYAARAGVETPAPPAGEGPADAPQITKEINDSAWYMSNAGYVTHPAGQKAPNAWGLHDMLGNVWEWVSDFYDVQRTPSSPQGPKSGTTHVLKGGSFNAHIKNVSPGAHVGGPGTVVNTGFRVVKDVGR